ncbi:MAG: succinate--CoA ligase subunit alpha [Rhodobiaceae bacterium]|nr:succinate--CoA ligase subunit alpha [Rhodobiaceae bacterium]MCC0041128.1 succinate--CoA ligase subunit alpha [Rhodobiaceae bacterium]
MAILVGADTRVIVQGMTGRAGTFYTEQALHYGSHYVAGVRPGKGGREHLGLPVFNTAKEAASETKANASLVMVPAHKAGDAMIKAIEAEVALVVCVTERVPVHDISRVKAALAGSDTILIGPNSQGILTPNACKIGVMPTTDATPGSIGIASRSASLTSEILAQTTAYGLGQSTTVGVGGDPIHGIGFRKCLELFRDDPETKGVILIGEVGGSEEEDAAAYLESVDYGKPVVALVVGRHAPKERRMGHAGTLSIFGLQSADEKIERLASAGVIIAENADDVAHAMQVALD